jgi:coenzyme F420-reducing hydrogenase gamma subunit
VCVTVAHGTPCLGPATRTGCGALCPSYDRGCFGCFGPSDTTNLVSLSDLMHTLGRDDRDLTRLYRTFNATAPEFATESARHDAARPGA